MIEITYHVPGMHCTACEDSIRKALSKVDGVQDVSVDLNSRHVHLRFDEARTDPVAIRKQLERAGFDVG